MRRRVFILQEKLEALDFSRCTRSIYNQTLCLTQHSHVDAVPKPVANLPPTLGQLDVQIDPPSFAKTRSCRVFAPPEGTEVPKITSTNAMLTGFVASLKHLFPFPRKFPPLRAACLPRSPRGKFEYSLYSADLLPHS